MKTSHVVIIGLAAVVVVGAINMFGVNYKYASTMPDQVAQEVFQGDKAIASYEWFKEQEAFIRECLENEKLAKEQYDEYFKKLPEDMTTWTDFMSKEEASLRAASNAHQKLTNKALEDYNAKSSMVNKSIFKELPTNIIRSAGDALDLTFDK